MFDNDYNIQARPTPTLFEKLAARDISPKLYGRAAYALIDSVLHGVIVAIGSFTAKTGTETFSLIDSVLHTVIVQLGTWIAKTGTSTLSLVTSELRTVIKAANPANTPTPFTANCQLTSSVLTLVVKSAGTFTINASSSCSLVSSVLA